MRKDIGLILIGAVSTLMIIGFIWIHFRVKGLENFANQLILNSQRQQTQQVRQAPQPAT
jgi:hypothetical protein